MKRLVMTLVIAGVMINMVSCGNKDVSVEKQADINDVSSAVTTDATQNERDSFEELPEDANGAFNMVINAAKNAYPVSAGFSRQYGYKGTKKVNGEKCYLFSVYDFVDDVNSVKVGEFAKSIENDVIYCKADGSKDFKVMENISSTMDLSFSVGRNDINSAVKLAAQALQSK